MTVGADVEAQATLSPPLSMAANQSDVASSKINSWDRIAPGEGRGKVSSGSHFCQEFFEDILIHHLQRII